MWSMVRMGFGGSTLRRTPEGPRRCGGSADVCADRYGVSPPLVAVPMPPAPFAAAAAHGAERTHKHAGA